MTDAPLVSVVMPVYGNEKYLEEAISSILSQTFKDFELIILADEPSEFTRQVLDRYKKTDDRINIYYQERLGLIKSLNKGCMLARGKYIARMDADDISLPERFEKQVKYLESHIDVGILGTWAVCINEESKVTKVNRNPVSSDMIRWQLLFGNCVTHSSVMMRKDVIAKLGYYSPHAIYAEDYDLWTRAVDITRISNIPEVLLKYRISNGSVSRRHSQEQEQMAINIMGPVIIKLVDHDISNELLTDLRKFSIGIPVYDLNEIELLVDLVKQLRIKFLHKYHLNYIDNINITLNTGRRVYILGLFATQTSFIKGIKICINAFLLNPLLSVDLVYVIIKSVIDKRILLC